MARILLVEDDESVRAFVERALELDRHSLVPASDGEEGLEIFARDNEGFDLVLSDIQMPCLDGIEMSRGIANTQPGQKILLMTGYANQRERASDLENIILDVVQKPFTLAEIRGEVRKALAA